MQWLTLGIETSCDETAAAVYSVYANPGLPSRLATPDTSGRTEKGEILSNVLYSQIALHKDMGGIMPELASRSQLEKIEPIVTEALQAAGVTLDDIDVIAVTSKPGLPGSLLVGVCFAKAMAFAKNKKLIGINHLEGHAFSSMIENDVPFPHLCITASGGHTSLYLINGYGDYQTLGQTRDDAAGEAFDKIARMLGLPYPGGPVIEKLAKQMNFQDFCKYPRGKITSLDFSFSGLKTAVLYDLVAKGMYDMQTKQVLNADETAKAQIASSLLVCIADIFEHKVAQAFGEYPHVKALTFVGGVACNKYITGRLRDWCEKRGLQFFVPTPKYCTDNAGMIAFVGNYKAEQGKYSDLELDILG